MAEKQQKHQAQYEAPTFWEQRNAAFEKALASRAKENAGKEKKKIQLRNNQKEIEAVSWETTPLQLLGDGLKATGDETVVACTIGAEQWDLTRPIEANCDGKELQWITFGSEEGRHIFWHSSAHILGEALEHRFHCLLNVGPATETDFYYDVRMKNDGEVVSASEFKSILQLCERNVKEKQPFERCELTAEEAKQVFAENSYKLAIINRLSDAERITAYRCGKLVDLCRGPHLPHTGYARAFAVTSTSSVYLEGKADSDVLQRVHGLSFPTKPQLKEWEALIAEAQRRDHRKLGQEQELFFFHHYSPGSAFFLPRGYRVYQKLCDFMRNEYHKRGYQEVLAPNILNSKLWEISGHWQHYQDNMFTFPVEDQPWALKPMNCPGHCLMFAWRSRSYRELPIRMAEFGVLHRNELSGALNGLTRVRRFQQDDGHIFCRPDQIEQEVAGVLDLIHFTYNTFGFKFRLELSTRPEKFLGEVELWDRAESALKNALQKFDMPWKLNPGDGAFYGPKIDVHIQDALRRFHQCATVQLDFQLPIRFNLQYMTSSAAAPAPVADPTASASSSSSSTALAPGYERPVMIHRAIFGSVERFFAILLEHTGGKWPFWVSPRQCIVLPVTVKHVEYARQVAEQIHAQNFFVDVDDSDRTLQKKIREAQLSQYNYLLVVGQEELDSKTVNVRLRDQKDALGKKSIPELIELFQKLQAEYK